MLAPERIAQGLTYYVVLLFSLSCHECAHAWAARRLGDDTAAHEGRISLNPLVHVDPVGTLLVPLMAFVWGGLPFLAWARPTPVIAANFRQGWFRRGQVLVAGAGPLSNLALALVFTLAWFVFLRAGVPAEAGLPLRALIETGVVTNLGLAVFNLVPLPPLDGSWMMSWGLPRDWGRAYDRLVEPYGQWLVLIAFGTGLLGYVITPIVAGLHGWLYRLAS